MFEIHHFETDLVLMAAKEVLRIIGAIKILTLAVFSRPGMIPPNDKMATAVVFSNKRMPNCFTRACHTHRKIEQRHGGCGLRVFI